MQVNRKYTEIPTRAYARYRRAKVEVWHGGRVGLVLRTRVEWLPVVVVAASLCELHSSGAACSKYNQEHIEPRSGEGACNSACYPCIRRNSKMADVFKFSIFHIRKKS